MSSTFSATAFQSTLPARGATTLRYQYLLEATFQSTLPARGATVLNWYLVKGCVFQSTLPARGATDLVTLTRRDQGISIHAPCTGSDNSSSSSRAARTDFNPRSLHGERRNDSDHFREVAISIHAPCTGSDCFGAIAAVRDGISIHAPCTGSDSSALSRGLPLMKFQSTLPARGATNRNDTVDERQHFQSTLPARGATGVIGVPCASAVDFNPRSLHGERRATLIISSSRDLISIHAPCTGSDRTTICRQHLVHNFNPRSLHGERPIRVY